MGKRTYKVMTPDTAWGATCATTPAHLYEVLAGPCNLYLDIEWKSDTAPGHQVELERVQGVIAHVSQCLMRLYNEDRPVVTMASASGAKSNYYKSSWHVHISCATVCWLNSVAVGQFVRDTCTQYAEVDKIPYAGTGQNWRCVGSAKFNEPQRRFIPADRSTFMACTVQQPVAGRRLVYPSVDVPHSIELPVPEYVQVLAAALAAGGCPRMCGHNRCAVPYLQRQFCVHAGRVHRSNHQYAVINLGTLMWKMSCHACTDSTSQWQTFPPLVLQSAYAAQVKGYVATVREPARRVETAGGPVHLDLRTLGPPPRREGMSVRCRDGLYIFQ